MAGTGVIYGLYDPQSGELRYVGQTVQSLNKRLTQHVCKARSDSDHRACWIRSVGYPEIRAIQELPIADLNAAEQYWIAFTQETGCRLVNATAGGEGGVGFPADVRAKIGASHRGMKHTEEARRKMSASKRAWSPEVRARVSENLRAAHVGKRLSLESIAKRTASVLGRKNSPETIEKMRQSALARVRK
jgi:GIY-YIG catalytic domain/NUMOD3 motif